MLPIAAKEEFIAELDANLAKAGYSNRSQFIRDAIIEKLAEAGIKIPRELGLAPPKVRAGRSRYAGRASSKTPGSAQRTVTEAAHAVLSKIRRKK